jgi:tetratricopeptide (TPR) repeat protein
MFERALEGYGEALGAKHTSTLRAIHNLGILYREQGKLKGAEEMFERALEGYGEALGAKRTPTVDTVYGLGNLYREQGEVAKAKEMYGRAAKGYQDVEADREAHNARRSPRATVLPDDISNTRTDAEEARIRHRKRDFWRILMR